ncbi:STAS domain-containing protein [Neptunomonas japonica]|uniref:STAS domain-containing protein n=1 Tax=Neptunomonas japonica TaxID=417574 RepID=UPI00041FEACC|nr:STAS domain-containing protein [Neptunomonas japonica]
MTNLATTTENANSTLHFVINDSFDALAVEILRPQLDELVQGKTDVVLNIENVHFIDSSGIGAIVFLFKRLRTLEQSLSIIGAHGQPLELMKHLRVEQTISVSESAS